MPARETAMTSDVPLSPTAPAPIAAAAEGRSRDIAVEGTADFAALISVEQGATAEGMTAAIEKRVPTIQTAPPSALGTRPSQPNNAEPPAPAKETMPLPESEKQTVKTTKLCALADESVGREMLDREDGELQPQDRESASSAVQGGAPSPTAIIAAVPDPTPLPPPTTQPAPATRPAALPDQAGASRRTASQNGAEAAAAPAIRDADDAGTLDGAMSARSYGPIPAASPLAQGHTLPPTDEKAEPRQADGEGPRALAASPIRPPEADTARPPALPSAPLAVRAGQFGHELGVAIARHAALPGDTRSETLTLRLDPPDHGRIEVKLSFEDNGSLRASVVASNPATLDLLRRDSADLFRALGQAGIGTDAQSFQFDARAQTGGQQRPNPYPHAPSERSDAATDRDAALPEMMAQGHGYIRLRMGGAIDLIT